ncbi:MAG: hypothetical protein GMKNLPBB_00912 [Myxococcota bacterium]|nr:hypothetical protein [Myxococcota bacterium]
MSRFPCKSQPFFSLALVAGLQLASVSVWSSDDIKILEMGSSTPCERFEPSAIEEVAPGRFAVGSDRHTALFLYRWDNGELKFERATPDGNPVQNAWVNKLEGLAVMEGKPRRLLAITAHDRPDETKGGRVNTWSRLLQFDLAGDGTPGPASVHPLSEKIEPAISKITGAKHIKVEGLSVSPNGRWLFVGVRQLGYETNWRMFIFVMAIYRFDLKKPEATPLELIRFEPASHPSIRRYEGLSSIAWDGAGKRYAVLTTAEMDESRDGIGATLWWIPQSAMEGPRAFSPKLARPVMRFDHKAEGLVFPQSGGALVVHDDDLSRKQPYAENNGRCEPAPLKPGDPRFPQNPNQGAWQWIPPGTLRSLSRELPPR